MTEAPTIDWRSATVEDGRLTVPFAGRPDAGWRERVEHVLGRLDGGGSGWGAIEVGKRKLKVDAVSPGSESDLRHLLESAVLQANADLPADEEEEADDGPSPADREMTEAFRAFADG
jgi:hypothetical protein